MQGLSDICPKNFLNSYQSSAESTKRAQEDPCRCPERHAGRAAGGNFLQEVPPCTPFKNFDTRDYRNVKLRTVSSFPCLPPGAGWGTQKGRSKLPPFRALFCIPSLLTRTEADTCFPGTDRRY